MATTPLPLVPNVYQVTTFGMLGSQPCDHVINWLCVLNPSQIDTAISSFTSNDIAAWTTDMIPHLPPDYKLTGSRCVYLGDTTHSPVETLTDVPGTSAGTFGVNFSAVTARWPAPGRGKGKDGRTNFPGPDMSYLDTDRYHINAAGITAYTSAFFAYTARVSSGVQLDTTVSPGVVILSRKTGLYAPPKPPFIDPYVNTHRRWVKRLARH